MEKEQVLKGGYKQNKFDQKLLVVIILSITLIVSVVINFSIINSVLYHQKYFNYLNTLRTTKMQSGVQEIERINPDFQAWLTCEDVNISLPIVSSSNSEFYFTHDFKKQKNGLGNPFFKTENENSQNKIIMASSTLTTTFFGTSKTYSLMGNFKKYLSENENFTNTITLETPTQTQIFKVISVYSFDVNSNYYDQYLPCNLDSFETEQDFEKFYNVIINNSAVDFNLSANFDDQFITIFLTDNDNLSNHIILVAKKS